jgi:hypothetical protein
LFSVKIAVWKGHSVFICYYILLQYWDLHTPLHHPRILALSATLSWCPQISPSCLYFS